MKDQPVWTPAGADITIKWREKYGYIPASELPDIKLKHDYYLNRRWNDKPTAQPEPEQPLNLQHFQNYSW